MRRIPPLVLAILVCTGSIGCGGDDSPTSPSATAGLTGQWAGTTSHGRPITFTVSSARAITSMTVGYNYASCSGSPTFSGLNIEIFDAQSVPGAPPPPYRYQFAGALGPYAESDNTQITGWFMSEREAGGVILFVRPGCQDTIALFNATKR